MTITMVKTLRSILVGTMISNNGGDKDNRNNYAQSLPRQSFLAPPGVDYAENPTVFGKILRGDLDANILEETSELLAFQDIASRAKLHGLIIPKRYIATIRDLQSSEDGTSSSDYLMMLMGIQDMAHSLLKRHLSPSQYHQRDYILCFHIPPFNSVDHLHLHVLAPASEMLWIFRNVKYNPRTRWCIGLEEVLLNLQYGKSAVPYQEQDSWWTIVGQVFQSNGGRNHQTLRSSSGKK